MHDRPCIGLIGYSVYKVIVYHGMSDSFNAVAFNIYRSEHESLTTSYHSETALQNGMNYLFPKDSWWQRGNRRLVVWNNAISKMSASLISSGSTKKRCLEPTRPRNKQALSVFSLEILLYVSIGLRCLLAPKEYFRIVRYSLI